MEMDLKEQQLRLECWDKRFYSYGTIKIFEQRAASLNRNRRWITFLGLVSPLTVGAVVLSFNVPSDAMKYIIIPLAGIIGIIQLVFSLWSLVARWDEEFAYAVGSIRENTRLTSEWECLATSPVEILTTSISQLRDKYTKQEMEDNSHHISDKEKRFAMRSALFQYKLACPTCGEVPRTMTPTVCDSCGNF